MRGLDGGLTVVAVPPNPLKSFRVDGALDGGLTVAPVVCKPLITLSLTVKPCDLLGNPHTPYSALSGARSLGSAAFGALAGEERGAGIQPQPTAPARPQVRTPAHG
jgi:hypothetical protein